MLQSRSRSYVISVLIYIFARHDCMIIFKQALLLFYLY